MDPVELTTSLVRTPGLSGSESAVADCIERTLQALEFHTVVRDKLGAVFGVIGPQETEVAVLLDGHMDVVPVTDGWTIDPFGAEIIGERLYGRGATDMRAGGGHLRRGGCRRDRAPQTPSRCLGNRS